MCSPGCPGLNSSYIADALIGEAPCGLRSAARLVVDAPAATIIACAWPRCRAVMKVDAMLADLI